MHIDKAEIIISAVSKDKYPKDNLPEFVLAGRSNVGKSSFINTLLNRKNLARTSSRPGKTQTLNFFLINERFYFVDVPGYGYAKVSKSIKEKFGQIIEEYLTTRENLKCMFLLVDYRHKPTEDDILMYNYVKYFNIPTVIVATKMDKLKKNDIKKNERIIKQALDFDENDLFIKYSSETRQGKDDVWNIIEKYLEKI